MPYKPYPIYDYKSGLHLAKKPWLIPRDAWQRMTNAHLWRGSIVKRGGYALFHKFVHFKGNESLGSTVDSQLTYTGTLANTPIDTATKAVSIDVGSGWEIFTETAVGSGVLTGDQGGSGTINYTTGAYSITVYTNPGNGKAIVADYNWNDGNAVMGIYNFYTQAGSSQLLAFDTQRMNKYDAVNDKMVDPLESDTFTGGNSDFFWCENWKDKLWLCNNVDRIKTWNGTALAQPDFDIDGGGNDIDRTLLIFAYKGHLVFLRPTEKGTTHPQRARWSAAEDPTDWTNDGFVDAPTLDWIMGADFLGDDLIVFFERSVWCLKYTSDPDLPFRWEKIVDTEGSYATNSVIAFSDEVLTLGPVSFIATDGMDAYSIDKKVPDIVLDINQDKFDYIYSFIIEEMRQIWVSYPTINSTTTSDGIIVLNYEDDAWSKYDLAMSCFGYHEESEEPTFDDVDDPWDSIEWRWDDRIKQAGYPINLGGDTSGNIWKLEQGTSDNGSAIAFDLLSGDWNPYYEEGFGCRLGWIDIFVERDPDTTLTFKAWTDNKSEGAYVLSQDITLDDGSGETNIWVRVPINVEGESVTVGITHEAINANVNIHAIVPFFKKAGKIGYG